MNKRVVVVTWTGVHNYGTALQSYSLQYAIEKLGYNVLIMDKVHYISIWGQIKRMIMNLLCILKRNRNGKSYRMMQFHQTFQKIFRPSTIKELQKLVSETDVFVSGSDQIWNTAYRYDSMMFLDFAKTKKRISYATSIGTGVIPETFKPMISAHLMKYSNISVREKTAALLLADLTGRNDIVTVLDPTFLLDHREWHLFAQYSVLDVELPEKYILCYFVGENLCYKQQVSDIKEKSGISNVVVVLLKETQCVNIGGQTITIDNASPNDFVKLIENASIICTDSFHATAISINFSKPFVEFLRFNDNSQTSQNSRIYDLLHHYGLSDYVYNVFSSKWLEPINYVNVNKILDSDRTESWTYLRKSLE